MIETLVSMEKITKSFGDNTVLSDLDLSVHKGEKLVLVGPSGSGKSTVLRVLMGLETPDSGTVRIHDRVLFSDTEPEPANRAERSSIQSKVGMVFQHFNLFPHMSVLNNLTVAPVHVRNLSKSEAEEKGRRLLSKMGLDDKAEAYPDSLSGGQKQRVAIARMLAMDPEVMLFDEITSALDPELVGEVLAVLRDLGDNPDICMLLVTHQMNFAAEFADEVLFFDSGRIVERGVPDRIFNHPQERRTQEFLQAVLQSS